MTRHLTLVINQIVRHINVRIQCDDYRIISKTGGSPGSNGLSVNPKCTARTSATLTQPSINWTALRALSSRMKTCTCAGHDRATRTAPSK